MAFLFQAKRTMSLMVIDEIACCFSAVHRKTRMAHSGQSRHCNILVAIGACGQWLAVAWNASLANDPFEAYRSNAVLI